MLKTRMVFAPWHQTPRLAFWRPKYRRGVYLFCGDRILAFMWEYRDTKAMDEDPS